MLKNAEIKIQKRNVFNIRTDNSFNKLFTQLKGLNDKESKAESKKMQESLDLTEKKNFQSHQLSGGMKRKLSVGIALCAGSFKKAVWV